MRFPDRVKVLWRTGTPMWNSGTRELRSPIIARLHGAGRASFPDFYIVAGVKFLIWPRRHPIALLAVPRGFVMLRPHANPGFSPVHHRPETRRPCPQPRGNRRVRARCGRRHLGRLPSDRAPHGRFPARHDSGGNLLPHRNDDALRRRRRPRESPRHQGRQTLHRRCR